MSMMRRRIIAIVASALALVILGFSLAAVLEYVKIIEWTDVDGETKYYAKVKDGVYELYAKGSDTPLPVDEQYKYYVTALGTLVSLDKSTGEVLKYIPVGDVERDEMLGKNDRFLLFPHLSKDDILSVEVHNSHGSFTFCRMIIDEKSNELKIDKSGEFALKNSPVTAFNLTLAEQLYNNAGYALSTMKVKDPIKDKATGEYLEYGLAKTTRTRTYVDEETGETVTEEYEYEPAYYIVTDIDGNEHKVIVGDKLVDGNGYYAQYVDISGDKEVKRDAVYVLIPTVGDSLLVSVETYVTPMVCYPLGMSNYYDVEDFVLGSRISDAPSGNYNDTYKNVISFTYIDLEDRKDTASAVVPYKFHYDLEGYNASDSAISSALYNLYSPTTVGTAKYLPSNQDLVDYGFFAEQLDEEGNVVKDEAGKTKYATVCKYILSYKYGILNEAHDGIEKTICQRILISDKDYETTGNYYTYSLVYEVDENGEVGSEPLTGYYDMISEVAGNTFRFLTWTEFDWVNPFYIDQDISFITQIKLTSGKASKYGAGYSAQYNIDNTNSDQSAGISTSEIFTTATHSLSSETVETFGSLKVYDAAQDYLWEITSTTLKVYRVKEAGSAPVKLTDLEKVEELKIDKKLTYYDYNALGSQVYCRTGAIGNATKDNVSQIWVNGKEVANAAGARVSVDANIVTIKFADARADQSYVRYSSDRYRSFFRTLLSATLVDDYDLTAEEEQALINDPEKHMLTMEVTVTDAEKAGGTVTTNVYKFYRLSARKAYITVNGYGGFYVYANRIEKFITDSQKFFSGDIIDPSAKN